MKAREIFVLALFVPQLALAATSVTVDIGNDEANFDSSACPGGDLGCSLREAVEYFNTGNLACGCTADGAATKDAVLIDASLAGTVVLSIPGANENHNATGDIDIFSTAASDLTIGVTNGASATIATTAGDRIFDVHARPQMNSVTFDSLILQNGTAPAPAADECGNTEAQDGGAIRVDYIPHFDIVIAVCVGTSSSHTVVTVSSATIGGSLAAANSAVNGAGIASQGAAVILNGATVDHNQGSGAGGGIYATSGFVSVQRGSQISNNGSVGNGGGVDIESNDSALDATSNVDCVTSAASVALCVNASFVTNNSSAANGGGIAQQNGDAVIEGGTITGNHATSGNGGGVFTGSGFLAVQSGSSLTGNSAVNGGGIFTRSINVTSNAPSACLGAGVTTLALCVDGSDISANHASGNGGGIDIAPAVGDQGTQIQDSATIGTIGNGNTAAGSGGGIYADLCTGTCTISINASSLSANVATLDGGGVANESSTLGLQSATIDHNSAGGNGGGIANFAAGASLVATAPSGPTKILKNSAGGVGGGIYDTANATQTVTLTGVHIGEAGNGNFASSAGGGLFVDYTGTDSTVTLSGASVFGNIATTGNGGGIAVDHVGAGLGMLHPRLTLEQSTDVSHNTAATNGGGLYNAANTTHTVVSGGTFFGNTATNGDGGAIDNQADGSAPAWPATSSDPCATPANASVFIICGTVFGDHNTGTAANSAQDGGAIANDSTLAIVGATIDGNATYGSGGAGIFNASAGSLFVWQTSITNNHANGSGDGGAVSSAGTAVLFGDELSGNLALGSGGGIYAQPASLQTVAIIYSTLTDNTAIGSAGGGGIATTSGQVILNDLTLAGNIATGGPGAGILSGGTNTQVANSIVDLNTAPIVGVASVDCSGSISSDGFNVFGSGSSCLGANDQSDSANATLLLDTSLQNLGGLTEVFALLAGSSALNSGAPNASVSPALNCGTLGFTDTPALTLPITDQRNVAIPQGGRCDSGALESTPNNKITISGAPATAGSASDSTATITVQNQGPDAAQSLVVTIMLPAHTVFRSATGANYTCAAPAQGSVGPLSFDCSHVGNLAAGSDTIALALRADAFFPANTQWGWTASVKDKTADPDASDNTAVCNTGCLVSASVSLSFGATNSDGASTLPAGSLTTYHIVLTNSGVSAAINASVTDNGAVPSRAGGVVSESWTCTAAAPSACPAGAGSGLIGTVLVTVAPNGGTVTFDLAAQTQLPPGLQAGDDISNDVSATASVVDGGTTVNAATDTDLITGPISEVGVSKTAPATIAQGATLTSLTTFVVQGPSATQAVTLTDSGGSAATAFASFTPSAAAVALFSCSGVPAAGTVGATTITCTSTAPVPVGTYVFTTTETIIDDGSSPSPIPYSASIALGPAAPPESATPPELPDSASGSVVVDIESDAAIVIDAPTSVVAGGQITYAVTVTNNGPSTARTLSWWMPIVASTSFVAFNSPIGWSCIALSVGGPPVSVTCSIDALAAVSGPQGFAVVVNVDDTAPNGARIDASALLGTLATDPNLADNGPVTATTVVDNDADLAVALSANAAEVAPGGRVDYRLMLTNNGPSAALMVALALRLPADAIFVSLTGADFSCTTPDASGLITCTIASIVPGITLQAVLVMTVSAAAANGETLTTTVNATSASIDAQPTNDSASAQVTVNRNVGIADPVTFGGVTVAHDQVRERGGFFRCDSMGGNGATDLAALLGAAFVASRAGGRRRKNGEGKN